MKDIHLVCTDCGASYCGSEALWRCSCGAMLDIDYMPDFSASWKKSKRPGLWRYRGILPIGSDSSIVSFGEGFTPLMPYAIGDKTVYIKNDHVMPTGSFKDRGATVLVSKLKELGIQSIVEDSSGNAGASIAAYAASAGIECTIYVPASTSKSKTGQITAFGATLVQVPGSREDTARAALAAAEDSYYASHVWNPWFIQGVKTIAYEVYEQLGNKQPDTVILPVGNGTLLLGLYTGFRELTDAGLIDRIPSLVAVQAEACCPLARAYTSGSGTSLNVVSATTVAEGIAVAEPARGAQILKAVRESGGDIITVEESEIIEAVKDMTGKGLFAEPTAASAWAGVKRYVETTSSDECIVSIITGHGLKASSKIESLLHGG